MLETPYLTPPALLHRARRKSQATAAILIPLLTLRSTSNLALTMPGLLDLPAELMDLVGFELQWM